MKRIKDRRHKRKYSALTVNGCVSVVNIQSHIFACTYVLLSSRFLTKFISA
jgi:hypothetical protein